MKAFDVFLWIVLVIICLCANIGVKYWEYSTAKSHEFCSNKGYWIKTSFTGQPVGIAMYADGTPIRCQYDVEASK